MFSSSRTKLPKIAVAASTSAVLGAAALAASLLTTTAYAGPVAQPSGWEKCFGVAKAGKNDCAAGAHSCAGQSTADDDKSSFVYLPRGVCERLVGGSKTPG